MAHKHMRVIRSEYIALAKKKALSVFVEKCYNENCFHNDSLMAYRKPMKIIYVVHSPTNALFINLLKSFKCTLKYTIISLIHVPVFNDHHQGAVLVPD